jgi:hypothetical protein
LEFSNSSVSDINYKLLIDSAMSNSNFDFNAFVKESKDVLVNPKSYFSTMKTTGGIAEPLIKAVIYGAVAGIITFVWSLLKIGGATMGILGGAVGVLAIVWYLIFAIIGLFIFAVIILVISAICKGSTDFEANVRVTAAMMVVMPVSALLGFITGLNLTAGAIIGLVVNLFALYLIYHGLVETLKANVGTTKIVMYVLAALMVLFFLLGLGAKNKASKFMKDFNNEDLKELLKDAEKN